MNKEKSKKAIEVKEIISQSIGSGEFYKHWIADVIYTEGVQAIANTAEAYWLIDFIVFNSPVRIDFQVWELKIDKTTETDDNSFADAIITLYNDTKEVKSWKMTTDFPCDIKFYLINDGQRVTLLLPQEY